MRCEALRGARESRPRRPAGWPAPLSLAAAPGGRPRERDTARGEPLAGPLLSLLFLAGLAGTAALDPGALPPSPLPAVGSCSRGGSPGSNVWRFPSRWGEWSRFLTSQLHPRPQRTHAALWSQAPGGALSRGRTFHQMPGIFHGQVWKCWLWGRGHGQRWQRAAWSRGGGEFDPCPPEKKLASAQSLRTRPLSGNGDTAGVIRSESPDDIFPPDSDGP